MTRRRDLAPVLLTEEQILRARRARDSGVTLEELGRRFGVSRKYLQKCLSLGTNTSESKPLRAK